MPHPLDVQDDTVGTLLLELDRAYEQLAVATDRELELQGLRGIQKDAAVRRVMKARNLAATPAEKIAEEDAEYSSYLKEVRSSVADRIRAEGRVAGARLRAQLAVKLASVRAEDVDAH